MRPSTLLVLLMSYISVSSADMYVDKSIVTFEPGAQPRQDVRVSNTSEDVIYVQVDAFVVQDPGAANEERVKVTDPQAQKLVATPNKLVIPAGGHKLVRILNLDPKSEQERIYRINVTPIVEPLAEGTSQLKIIVAYQILAIVQPHIRAHDWLDASTLCITVKFHQCTKIALIGNSNGGPARCGNRLNQWFDASQPIDQREFCVNT